MRDCWDSDFAVHPSVGAGASVHRTAALSHPASRV